MAGDGETTHIDGHSFGRRTVAKLSYPSFLCVPRRARSRTQVSKQAQLRLSRFEASEAERRTENADAWLDHTALALIAVIATDLAGPLSALHRPHIRPMYPSTVGEGFLG